jgi:hypothetical protein
MISESYKWAVVPEGDVSVRQKKQILESSGFQPDGDHEYVRDVNDWKKFRAKIESDGIEFSFHWPGTSVTSAYYDYLVKCGMIIECIKMKLEYLDVSE